MLSGAALSSFVRSFFLDAKNEFEVGPGAGERASEKDRGRERERARRRGV